MKFRIRFASQVVGFFLIAALAAMVVVVVFLGINQRWFAKNYKFFTYFASANGIKNGMGINFKGFAIGKVTDVTLDEDNRVKVSFYIEDRFYNKVYQHSVLALLSNPLGLGGGIVFYQGKEESPPIPEGNYIPSLDFEDGQKLVESGLVDVPPGTDAINRLLAQIEPILKNLDKVLVSLNSTLNTVDSGLKGNSQIALGQALKNVALMSENLKTLSDDLSNAYGIIPRLLGAEGSLAKILNDNMELYNKINTTLNSLQESMENIKTLTEFLKDSRPQISGILEEGKDAIKKGKEVLEGVRNNPLIRGGVPEEQTQETRLDAIRDEEF
ncbi:MlaD family protein [Spirochaetia bacterium 38H-sp]|uniref:MlaD family protein n=1 Tax=Rarispira pelagica TaxID=3141764 RepID=A0ABU9UAZ9_9SPIR